LRKLLTLGFILLLLSPTFVTFVSASPVNVQSPSNELTFRWDFMWGGNDLDSGSGIVSDNGNLYVTGWTRSFGAGENDVFLLKIDKGGNVVWARTWGTGGYEAGQDLRVKDDAVYVAGSVGVLKFGKEGGLMWSKKLVVSDPAFEAVAIKVVGTQIYVGSLNCQLAKLVEQDGSVKVEWALNLPFEASIIEVHNNSIYVAHRYAQKIAMLAGNGQPLWVKELNMTIADIAISSGAIFVLGYGCICKLSLDGNLLWAKTWDTKVYGSAVCIADGYVYVAGYYGFFDDGFISVLDSNGNMICSYIYGDSGDDWFTDIIVSNGKMYAVGNTISTSRSLKKLATTLKPIGLVVKSLEPSVEYIQANIEDVQGAVTSPTSSSTGILDVFVASFELSARPPDLTLYTPEIDGMTVTINGVTAPGTPGTSITKIHWNWGDGFSEDHLFPASHTYSQAGTYTVTVTSYQSDGLSTSKSVTVTVSPLPSAFKISAEPSKQTVRQGGTATFGITVTSLTTSVQTVSLSLTGYHETMTYSFDPSSGNATFTSTLTVRTSSLTPVGNYTLTITGTSKGKTYSVNVDLIISRFLYEIEIRISEFRIKKDMDWDPLGDYFGAADPYFILYYKWLRSPKQGFEIDVGDDELNKSFVGPIVIVQQPTLSFPMTVNVKAMDNDFARPDEDLTPTVSFQIDSLPFSGFYENEKIYFKIEACEITPIQFSWKFKDEINDPEINKQQYWFEIGANLVFHNYDVDSFSDVVVAVLDTGVNYSHPDLKSNMWLNLGETGFDGKGRDKRSNGVDDDNNGYIDDWRGIDLVGWSYINKTLLNYDNDPMDEGAIIGGTLKYHGTGIAGVIAAGVNNKEGIAGIAPNVKIMSVRVIPETIFENIKNPGAGNFIKGINYAVENGADIISLSLGAYSFKFPWQQNELQEAVNYAIEHGVLLVAAVGNDRTSKPSYPAAFWNVISVSAIENFKFDYSYSNYGPDPEEPQKSIELSAPGIVYTTTSEKESYIFEYGTSVACPIVSATAALVIGYVESKYGVNLTVGEIRQILAESATDLGPKGWDPYYGYGAVNACRALELINLKVKSLSIRLPSGEIAEVKASTNSTSLSMIVLPEENRLKFIVTGLEGTVGVLRVFIPNSLFEAYGSSINRTRFILDGEVIQPYISTEKEGYRAILTYTHSTSTIEIYYVTYDLAVEVVDYLGKPLSGVSVILSGPINLTATTNELGVATFVKLPVGKYHIDSRIGSVDFSLPEILSVTIQGKVPLLVYLLTSILILAVFISGLVFLLKKKHSHLSLKIKKM